MILDRIERLRKQPLPVRQQVTALVTFISVLVVGLIWFVAFFSTLSVDDFKPKPEVVPVRNDSGLAPPFSE